MRRALFRSLAADLGVDEGMIAVLSAIWLQLLEDSFKLICKK
jgi:hypothetical protein